MSKESIIIKTTKSNKVILPIKFLDKIISNCKEENKIAFIIESKSDINITFTNYNETIDLAKKLNVYSDLFENNL